MKRHRSRVVPLPPMPADPSTTCRWCVGKVRDGRCLSGCRSAALAPYGDVCTDCGREFSTGKAMHAYVCWQCERRAAAGMVLLDIDVRLDREPAGAAIDKRDRDRARVEDQTPRRRRA